MAGMWLKDLRMSRCFKFNKVVFCLRDPFKRIKTRALGSNNHLERVISSAGTQRNASSLLCYNVHNCWFPFVLYLNNHRYYEIGANVSQPLSCIPGAELSVVFISKCQYRRSYHRLKDDLDVTQAR